MATHVSVRLAFSAWLALGLFACASEDPDDGSPRRADDAAIVSGKAAPKYTEAVLLSLYRGGTPMALCSGALVAPKVVLTAGHCVYGWDGWSVEAPYAGAQKAVGEDGSTLDWKAQSEAVDPTMHDLGLVFLSTPITLKSYPTIAQKRVPFGSKVENIGRIHDGTPSFSKLFIGRPVTVEDGKSYGFPYAYAATDVIESGDSGGPVVRPATHEIVAVNSGGGNGLEVLARTDLVSDWISQQIEVHGGSGSDAASPASGCGSLTFSGRCTGDKVEWCEADVPRESDCAASGRSCKYDKSHKYYDCL